MAYLEGAQCNTDSVKPTLRFTLSRYHHADNESVIHCLCKVAMMLVAARLPAS